MEKVTAHGLLRHRFWGEYSAVIGLTFTDEYSASAALPSLGNGWKVVETHKKVLIWSGNSEALKEVSNILERFGADRKKIASCAKSIDYGEPFKITVPIIPKEQLTLL